MQKYLERQKIAAVEPHLIEQFQSGKLLGEWISAWSLFCSSVICKVFCIFVLVGLEIVEVQLERFHVKSPLVLVSLDVWQVVNFGTDGCSLCAYQKCVFGWVVVWSV